MTNTPDTELFYVNVYESAHERVTLSHRYHATASDAKEAARGTCASGKRRHIARIKVQWKPGQFDD